MAQPNKLEAERQRLAQRLDEDIIAQLRILQAQTEAYRGALQSQPDAHTALSIISSLLHQLMQHTQFLRHNLHPTILETLGLEPALEALARDLQHLQGVHINLQMSRLPHRLASNIEMTLFRTIQILIDHAIQQARATQFTLKLTFHKETVEVIYTDNGHWLPSGLSILPDLQSDIEALNGMFQGHLTENHTLHIQLTTIMRQATELTSREQEVLQYVAQGMTNKEIANQLHVSTRTISFHLDNTYSKLEVSTRTEAVMVALQRGWIENPVK